MSQRLRLFGFVVLMLWIQQADFAKESSAQASVHPSDRAGYPEHWWTPVPRDGAPNWEILPQDAGPGEVILSKRHELGLLSNFAATPITYHGKTYASLEGFWQSLLYPENDQDPRAIASGVAWTFKREDVEQMTAFDAKHAGELASANMKTMGLNWVTFEGRRMDYWTSEKGDHYKLIVELAHAKIEQHQNVRDILLSTGDLILKPDHKQEADAPPAWRYNEIYMDIRSEYQNKK